MTRLRVAVVGHCAAGKSTVVELLQRSGQDAYSVAQEHSVVRDLWNHQNPDRVLYLDVSLAELRARKHNPDWPEWIYNEQERRLAGARDHASLVINTDMLSPESIAEIWQEFLQDSG